MPLVGGGGAGNVAGGNPAGTGTGLNYLGEHAYAYSGNVTFGTGDYTSLLNFTTGGTYIVGYFQVSSTSGSGVNTDSRILLNGEAIMQNEYGSTGPTAPDAGNPTYIIVPPYSNVKFDFVSQSGDLTFQVMFTGRVYA